MANVETILLVEDEPAIRQLIAASLERSGYRVLQARTGREALECFDDTVDLLLTDMRLPHLGGAGLIQQLRAQRRTLKIISISGFALNQPPADVPFLAKPFTREDLLKTVRAVLGDQQSASTNVR
jgi:DNA-binding response OmpR family regulator